MTAIRNNKYIKYMHMGMFILIGVPVAVVAFLCGYIRRGWLFGAHWFKETGG
jgi:hypothetical protein